MLKDDIDLTVFFSVIHSCKGNVSFLSSTGDCLNLKSALCQYLFTSAFLRKDIQLEGSIQCEFPEDAECIQPFLKKD